MHFPPQTEKEVRIESRQLVSPMDAGMTAPAERDVDRRPVHAGPAVVHDQRLRDQPRVGETGLATTIAREDGVAVSGKVKGGAAAPVITGAAVAAGDQRGAATGPAPPGRLPFPRRSRFPALVAGPVSEHPDPLERQPAFDRGREQARLEPGGAHGPNAASGQIQMPGSSSFRSAADTKSASSGRWAAMRERMRAARRVSAGERGGNRRGRRP